MAAAPEPVPGKGPASERTAQCHGCSASSHPTPSCLPITALPPSRSLHAFLSLLPSLFILPPVFSFPPSLFHFNFPLFPPSLPSFFPSFFPSFRPSFLCMGLVLCFTCSVSGCLGLILSQALSPEVLLVTVWPRACQRLRVSASSHPRAGLGPQPPGLRCLEVLRVWRKPPHRDRNVLYFPCSSEEEFLIDS